MEEKPSYYAIIPAEVRYDDSLRAGAKIFYGEITALCSKYGVCTASNNYFAELYGMTPSGITHWVTQLKNKGYIAVEYEKEGKVIKQRKIILKPLNTDNLVIDRVLTNINTVLTKVNEGTDKSLGGYLQKDKENNININNTSNNNIKEIVDYLNARLGTNYKNTTKQTQSMINARFKEGFTVEDFKKVIDKKYKEWRGTEFEQYLTPQTLFGTKFEKYLNQKSTKEVDPYAGVPRL